MKFNTANSAGVGVPVFAEVGLDVGLGVKMYSSVFGGVNAKETTVVD